MVDKPHGASDAKPAVAGTATTPTPPARRGPGHRSHDVRDTVAEMAQRAHEISLEAGSKMAASMKEVISAAAGLTAFAIESARDLVQYMVRRGQMTQDEADKLLREAEEAQKGRKALVKVAKPANKLPVKVASHAKPVVAHAAAAKSKSNGAARKPAKSASRKSVKPAAKKKR